MTPSLDALALPDFLERRDDGAIVIRGHRIKQFRVLDSHLRGRSHEDIEEEFPTLSPGIIRRAVQFYNDNRPACDAWYQACCTELDRLSRESARQGPTLDELRRRREERRAAQAKGR